MLNNLKSFYGFHTDGFMCKIMLPNKISNAMHHPEVALYNTTGVEFLNTVPQAGGGRKIEFAMPIVLDVEKIPNEEFRNLFKHHPWFNGEITPKNASLEKLEESKKIYNERLSSLNAPNNIGALPNMGGSRKTRKNRRGVNSRS